MQDRREAGWKGDRIGRMEGRQAGRRIHQRGNTAGPSGLLEAEEEGSAPKDKKKQPACAGFPVHFS